MGRFARGGAAFASTLLLALGTAAAAGPAPTVLFPGDPVPFAEMRSAGWTALCLDGAPALKKVALIGVPAAGRGKVIAADGCEEAVFFIRNAPAISERSVKPLTFEKQEASAKIDAGDGDINLWVTAEEPNGPYMNVERDGQTQYFWTRPTETWDQWSLVWAGDVDADGKADFVTRAWDEKSSGRALFLSGDAGKDRLYSVSGRPFEVAEE